MSSEDLQQFEAVNPIMLLVQFTDDKEDVFSGWLEMDEKEFIRAKSRRDCPKDKSSMAYYYFLQEQAEAVPASPDHLTAPLTRRNTTGDITAAYIQKVTFKEGQIAIDLRRASEKETAYMTYLAQLEDKKLDKLRRTFFVTAFMWKMHQEMAQKRLTWPSSTPE